MQAERTRWTDERIDDLASDLKSLRAEMKEGFAKVDARLDRLDTRLERMNHILTFSMASFLVAIAAGYFAG